MLNIFCLGGEIINNIDSFLLGSLIFLLMFVLNDVFKFEDVEYVFLKKNRKGGKVFLSNEKLEEEDGWVLNGENVVEFCDLFGDCDVIFFQDIIVVYGVIIEFDVISLGLIVFVRYQYVDIKYKV